MSVTSDSTRQVVLELLEEVLHEPLPGGWPLERPLVDAGLDSVGVLHLVAAIEARLAVSLPDADLTAENFATVGALARLIRRRTAGD